jgi:hypothetical protein
MAGTQTLIPTQDVADGTGLNLTALLAAPTGTTLLFSNTGRERLYVSAGGSITTTVASGSNSGEISTIASWSAPSAGVLDVASSASFPSGGGTVTVAASGSTTAIVNYTGTGSGTLTGCTYVSGSPTGTVSTGGAVALASETVTVDVGALVDGQTVAAFPTATLTASDVYQFGPFHSVLDNNGTNQVQVVLSSVNNVTIALLQGIGVF